MIPAIALAFTFFQTAWAADPVFKFTKLELPVDFLSAAWVSFSESNTLPGDRG